MVNDIAPYSITLYSTNLPFISNSDSEVVKSVITGLSDYQSLILKCYHIKYNTNNEGKPFQSVGGILINNPLTRWEYEIPLEAIHLTDYAVLDQLLNMLNKQYNCFEVNYSGGVWNAPTQRAWHTAGSLISCVINKKVDEKNPNTLITLQCNKRKYTAK